MATTFRIDFNGTPVYGDVSLCSQFPGHGLQFSLSTMANSSNMRCEFVHVRHIKVEHANSDEAVAAATEEAIKWLRANGVKTLQDKVEKANIELAALRKETDVWMAKEKIKRERLVATNKAAGFTHYFEAWVHPRNGDDYEICAFKKGAFTPADITSLLKKSVIKTDYRVTEI